MKFLYIHCHKHLLLLYLSLKILNHQKMLLVFKHTTQYILLKLSIFRCLTKSILKILLYKVIDEIKKRTFATI